jgi:zinc protease
MRHHTAVILAALLCMAAAPMKGDAPVTTDAPVLLPVKNDPTICFRLWFKTGFQDDPAGKEGLAQITAAMLTDGATTAHSYESILDMLYPLAAGYDATTSAEMTVVYGRVHRDNLREYYPLLVGAVTSPAFRQEDLDRIKGEALTYLETTLRYSSDEELGKAVLYNDIYAGTPYGHLSAGTVRGISGITLEDVRGFYAAHFTRENVVVGLGGGYDESLPATLRKDLERLPSARPVPAAASVPAPAEGTHVTIVEKDAGATAISLGFPISLLRGQREWYALAVANSWLGEHRNSSSHLYQVIREARGLNYGDYSYIEHFPGAGMRSKPPQNVCRRQQIFEIWIRPVPNETAHFALRAALREFRTLSASGMSREDFVLTKKFLKNYVLHYAPTTMERLGYAIDDRFYGIAGSHLATFRAMMDVLTLEEVNAAMRKYWNSPLLRIGIVTRDAKGLRDALVADAPSPITYKTPKPDAVLREDTEIAVFPLKIAPGNVMVVPVGNLFQ